MLFFSCKDLPDRSGIFYVKHPQSWSPLDMRRYFQKWGHPFCEACDPTTEIVALPLKNETTDSRTENTFEFYKIEIK